jgi:ComEC/Rec2-related protein
MRLIEGLAAEPKRFSPPVAAAVGTAIGFYPLCIPSSAALAAALLVVSFGIALRLFGGRGAALNGFFIITLGTGMAAGIMASAVEKGRAQPNAEGPESSSGAALSLRWIEGRLISDSTPAKHGFRVYALRVDRLGLSGAAVESELDFPDPGTGPVYRILVRNGDAFDCGVRLRASGRRGDDGALFVQPRDIQLLDRGGPLDRLRGRVRSACRSALARVGSVSAGLLEALILGVRDSLSPGEAEAFKAAGCSHILALSGEHLSVLAVISIAALTPLLGPIKAKLGGAVLATLFMWIAGAGPSLLRAVIAAWIGALAVVLDRPQSALTVLSITFTTMTIIDPGSARSLSFVLSYGAVWGLAVLGPRFEFLLGRHLPPFLRGPTSASLAAQTAVSPILALTFGCLQFAGIPATIAAGPLVTAMMWWGLTSALVCSLVPAATPLAVAVSDALYRALTAVIDTAAALPPLPLTSPASRLAGAAAIVLIGAAVYARPYAEYRLARLRLADGPARLSRCRVACDVQALRAEFSDKPPPAGADSRRTRRRQGFARLGNRPRCREHDRDGAGRGTQGHGLRDRSRLRPASYETIRR